LIEAKKPVVLLESVVDQIGLDNLEEVPIQSCVNEEVYDLLNSVPDVVDMYVSVLRSITNLKDGPSIQFSVSATGDNVRLTCLHPCGNPDTKNANVDHCNDGCGSDHYHF
jgi:hypothetical protein